MLLATCTTAEPGREEVEAALERLQPRVTDVEVEEAIEACLEENAVTSLERVPGGGGFVGRGVTARDQQVLQDCKEQAFERFPDWPPPQPETPAEHRVFYDLYLEMTECLRQLGYEIIPPSFDSYYDRNGEWYPYRDLPELIPEDWELVNGACPQDPWTYSDRG